MTKCHCAFLGVSNSGFEPEGISSLPTPIFENKQLTPTPGEFSVFDSFMAYLSY